MKIILKKLIFAITLLTSASNSWPEEIINNSEPPEFTVFRVMPDYPMDARRQNIEGKVSVKISINIDGKVDSAEIIKSNPPGIFDDAAISAAKQWIFKPQCSVIFSQPFKTVIPFNFQLGQPDNEQQFRLLMPLHYINRPGVKINDDGRVFISGVKDKCRK